MSFNTTNALVNKPIDYNDRVKIYIPKVSDICEDSTSYNASLQMFTRTTRELFVLHRYGDKLAKEYPTMLDLINEDELDVQMGKVLNNDKESEEKMSDIIIKSLSYWTKLPVVDMQIVNGIEDNYGFIKLSNGKIMHIGKEWIIDSKEFTHFSNYIKDIAGYKPPEQGPPEMTSDSVHKSWVNHYTNRMKMNNRKSITLTDKILSLSVETGMYKVDEILDMNIFVFNKVSEMSGLKEAYMVQLQQYISGNFKMNGSVRHWKQNIDKTSYVNSENNKK